MQHHKMLLHNKMHILKRQRQLFVVQNSLDQLGKDEEREVIHEDKDA